MCPQRQQLGGIDQVDVKAMLVRHTKHILDRSPTIIGYHGNPKL